MRAIRFTAAALALAVGLGAGLHAAAAGAAEIEVLSAGAMRAILQQLGPAFEAASGHHLALDFATAGDVEKQVAGGAAIDVAILTRPRIDKLQHAGKVAGPTTQLARAEIGLAVRAGAPRPDITTVEAVKRALLAASSIAYTDPASGGTSGIHLAHVLAQLGLADELKPRTLLVGVTPGHNSPLVGEVVASGEAAIGMQPISELLAVEGIDVVGPLPAELQSPDLLYVAGVPAVARQPEAARALIEFLAGPSAAPFYRAKGLQPG